MFGYLLLEKKKIPSNREFEAFLDLFPWDYKDFPILFSKKDLSYLDCNTVKGTIGNRKAFYQK